MFYKLDTLTKAEEGGRWTYRKQTATEQAGVRTDRTDNPDSHGSQDSQ